MKLEFTKMQGAGNDFVVLDGIRQSINPTPELIRALADRRFGIGADQVLLLEAAKHEGEPRRYRIFNNTGGEVEQCGNGARCIGRFALEAGYAAGDRVDFETMKGRICVRAEPDGRTVVDVGCRDSCQRKFPLCLKQIRRCLNVVSILLMFGLFFVRRSAVTLSLRLSAWGILTRQFLSMTSKVSRWNRLRGFCRLRQSSPKM